MKLMIYKEQSWIDFETLEEPIFNSGLDGYNGSEKVTFFKVVKEVNDLELNNVSIRLVHFFNNEEHPLEKIANTNEVQIISGDEILKEKIKYSMNCNINLSDLTSGTPIIPDENGIFRIGDLTSSKTEIQFGIKTIALPRIVTNFSQKVELSNLYLQFYYSE